MHRSFTFLVIIRVMLLIASLGVFAFIFGRGDLIVNHIIIAVIIIAQVVELIRFVNRTNRELARLFNAIAHGDFNIAFPPQVKGRSFDELETSLSHIINAFRVVTIEREAQQQLVQRLINQINVGIIAVQNGETISLLNRAAETLLGVGGIRSWTILKQKRADLVALMESMGENGRKLVEWRTADETRIVSIDVTTGQLLEQPHRLIIVQDINNEIEQKEIEAWHKLIRILTHEIMNSVTPIASLTETTQSMLQQKDGRPKSPDNLAGDTIGDIVFSLSMIQKRTEGLLRFVDDYRALSRVPNPSPTRISLHDVIDGVRKLMQEELGRRNIQLILENLENIPEILADRGLVEQVLINLISNSVHALDGRPDPYIRIAFTRREGRNVFVQVEDNGQGIGEKELPHIFVPFFSTRKEGSGIGLSLSKQIMAGHNGSIKVKSVVSVGTTFTLRFPID